MFRDETRDEIKNLFTSWEKVGGEHSPIRQHAEDALPPFEAEMSQCAVNFVGNAHSFFSFWRKRRFPFVGMFHGVPIVYILLFEEENNEKSSPEGKTGLSA
jgi:hypothetical protein